MYLHEWLIFMVNVGKYTVRPMDPSWVYCRFKGFSDLHFGNSFWSRVEPQVDNSGFFPTRYPRQSFFNGCLVKHPFFM